MSDGTGDAEEWEQIESRLDAVLHGDVESLLDESLTALRSLQDEDDGSAHGGPATTGRSTSAEPTRGGGWTSPENDFDPNSELAQVLDNLHRMGDDPTLPAQTVSAFTSTPKAPTWTPVSGATPIGYGKTPDISGAVLGIGDTAGRLPSAEGLERLEAASSERSDTQRSETASDPGATGGDEIDDGELPPLPSFRLTGPEIDDQPAATNGTSGAETRLQDPLTPENDAAAPVSGGAFGQAIALPGPQDRKTPSSPAARTAPSQAEKTPTVRSSDSTPSVPASTTSPKPVSSPATEPNSKPSINPAATEKTDDAEGPRRWSVRRRRSKTKRPTDGNQMPLGQVVPIEEKPSVTTTRPPGAEEAELANPIPAGTMPNLKPKVARPKNDSGSESDEQAAPKPDPRPVRRSRPPAGFEADQPAQSRSAPGKPGAAKPVVATPKTASQKPPAATPETTAPKPAAATPKTPAPKPVPQPAAKAAPAPRTAPTKPTTPTPAPQPVAKPVAAPAASAPSPTTPKPAPAQPAATATPPLPRPEPASPAPARRSRTTSPASTVEVVAKAPSRQPGTSLAQPPTDATKASSTLDRFAAAAPSKTDSADTTSPTFDTKLGVFPAREDTATVELNREPPLIDLLATKKVVGSGARPERAERVRGQAPTATATAIDTREELADSLEMPSRGLGYLAGVLLLMVGLGAIGYALIANAGGSDNGSSEAESGVVQLDPHTVDVRIDGCDESGVVGTLTNSADHLVFTTVHVRFMGESGVEHHDGLLRGIEIDGSADAQYNFKYTENLVPAELQNEAYECSVEVQAVSARDVAG